VQAARSNDDVKVETEVLRRIATLNNRADGRGSLGVVWGATRDAPEFDFSQLGGPILVPGLGAQGATASHVARLFHRCPPATVLVNVGRDILYRGPDQSSIGDGAQRWRDDLSSAIL
jgi:orotidine-5'-phosphate decarboxylase